MHEKSTGINATIYGGIMKYMQMSILFLVVVCFAVSPSLGSDTYDHSLEAKKMKLAWKVDGDALNIQLSAPTTGWVGIGFNPSKEMKDANFIIGYVKNGKVKIRDDFGVKERQHEKDTKVGGKNNVSNPAGSEENGITEISFSIPLDSGDPKDSPITVDADTTVLLGYSTGRDSFRTKHQSKSRAILKVNFQTGKFTLVK
jgi:hypothetical protein